MANLDSSLDSQGSKFLVDETKNLRFMYALPSLLDCCLRVGEQILINKKQQLLYSIDLFRNNLFSELI